MRLTWSVLVGAYPEAFRCAKMVRVATHLSLIETPRVGGHGYHWSGPRTDQW